ncbi:hypothetical protein [Neobacillus notoginsengisoli]|nr:hypothetical protein [Neobacillus notoginsengisoli]
MAMNTSLQVNKTENVNKATDLAEMGITYYKDKIDNIIVKAFTAKTITKPTELDTLLNEMKNEVTKIQTEDGKQNVSGSGISYEIRNLSVDISNPSKILITFRTIGNSEGEKRELSLALNYTIKPGKSLPLYKVNDPGTFSSSSSACHNPQENTNIINQNCFYNPTENVPGVKIENSTLKIIGNEEFDHFKNVTSSKIYVTGDILLNKVNNITNLRLHVEGDLIESNSESKFNNFGGITLIEIEKNAIITSLNNLGENFEMIIGKNLTVNEFKNNTTGKIIVYGDANINAVNSNTNVTMCVFGKYSGYQPKPSYIKVYGEPGFESDSVCGPYARANVPFLLDSNREESIIYK